MKKLIKVMPYVMILWDDAETEAGWLDPDDMNHDKKPVPSIGFVAKRTRERIYLASTWDVNHGNFTPTLSIPRAWIRKEFSLGELRVDLSSGRFVLKCHRRGIRGPWS